jgi:hypothetical protein
MLPIREISQNMWFSTSPTLKRSFLGFLYYFSSPIYWFISTMRGKVLLMHTLVGLTPLCTPLQIIVRKIFESILLESNLILSLPLLRRILLMFRMIMATLGLPYGVLQGFGLVKFNFVLVGLLKSTEKTLYPYFLTLEVRNIPQKLHKYLSICIHSNFFQLMLMEFLDLVIKILL